MPELHDTGRFAAIPSEARRTDDVIESVVSLVAMRARRNGTTADPVIVAKMSIASRSPQPDVLRDLMHDMRDSGISRIQITDCYIPAVARDLGQSWSDDLLSFADVTIGTARLQAVLADLGREDPSDFSAPQIALIVQKDDRHTLGAVVAANQLRRMGLAVQLILGHDGREIASVLRDGQFDAVFISAAATENLATLHELVKKIRVVTSAPVVIGGSVTDLEADIRSATGADHATADPKEALQLCGLKIPINGVGRHGVPG